MAQVAQFCAADGSTLAMGQPVEMQVRERVFAAMCIQPCHAATATPVAVVATKAETDGRPRPASVAVRGKRTRLVYRPIPGRRS